MAVQPDGINESQTQKATDLLAIDDATPRQTTSVEVKAKSSRRKRGLGLGLDLDLEVKAPAQLSFADVFVRRRASSLGVADAKSHFSEIIEKLNNGSFPPILVHRYVEPQAAIVGIEDYYVSETLISKLQDYVARSTNRRRNEIGVGEMMQFLDEAV